MSEERHRARQKHEALVEALEKITSAYVDLAYDIRSEIGSKDWDPESDEVIIEARAALKLGGG